MKEITATEAIQELKPDRCVLVVSADKNGKANAMTCAWNMKISHEPALFGISLSNGGHTSELIRESKEFVIAVPGKELEEEVLFCGTHSGKDTDKFKEFDLQKEKAKFVNCPLLPKATFNFECRLEKEVAVGDHTLFIGRILTAYYNPEKKVLFTFKKVDGKRVFREL